MKMNIEEILCDREWRMETAHDFMLRFRQYAVFFRRKK